MACLGAATGTLTTCGCTSTRVLFLVGGNGIKLGKHPNQRTSSVFRRSLQCRADANRSSQGRISKNAVDASASSLSSTSDDMQEVSSSSTESPKTVSQALESSEQKPKSPKERKPEATLEKILMQKLKLDKAMDEIVGFMAPREKGDIRDVILMSLSFSVFIYISQRLVCAYCVLRHMIPHSF